MMRTRLNAVGLFLLIAIPSLAAPQATAGHGNAQFVSRACRFQVKIPAGWSIKPSPSKKCDFLVIVPERPDGDVQLLVRNGDLAQGSDDLGFTKDQGKWMLQGEGYSEAHEIDSPTWTGLQGSVDTRIYGKKGYLGLGNQTRALLFDRRNRIAEVTCYNGDEAVPEFVKGFEFLAQP
jgi:hypothetical protein